ncbi:MAG: outer membrane beta-barrel protein [Betaproteobacteria bacterium]|jgi:hypothetical protein
MRNFLTALAIASFFLSSLTAQAQLTKKSIDTPNNSYYVEAGMANLNITNIGVNSGTSGTFIGKLGWNVRPYLATEFLAGAGVYDARYNASTGTAVLTTVNHIYGIYAKPRYQNGNWGLFARLGFDHINAKPTVNTGACITASATCNFGSSITYGIGAQYSLSQSFFAQIDWMSYYNKGNSSVKGPSASIGMGF